ADDEQRHADHDPDCDPVAGGETDGAPSSPRAAHPQSLCDVDRHRVESLRQPVHVPKIAFFCFWMLLTRPLTSFGLFRNCCSAGIITVDAKSGRVSRSMYCAMCFAPAISFAAFFCSGL